MCLNLNQMLHFNVVPPYTRTELSEKYGQGEDLDSAVRLNSGFALDNSR